jgi:hypothetical protein
VNGVVVTTLVAPAAGLGVPGAPGSACVENVHSGPCTGPLNVCEVTRQKYVVPGCSVVEYVGLLRPVATVGGVVVVPSATS